MEQSQIQFLEKHLGFVPEIRRYQITYTAQCVSYTYDTYVCDAHIPNTNLSNQR